MATRYSGNVPRTGVLFATLLLATVATGCSSSPSQGLARICDRRNLPAIAMNELDLGVLRVRAPKGYALRKSRGWHGEVVLSGANGEIAYSQGHWGPSSFKSPDERELRAAICELRIDGMPVHVYEGAPAPDRAFRGRILAHIDFPLKQPGDIGMQVLMHAEIGPEDKAGLELFRQLLWNLRRGDPALLLRVPGEPPERRMSPPS